ncbi:hypothetical protein OG217_25335 [Streptomyces sp. NBC_01023]|uniref:hypothetical protein n=1 Tax=unclassified Streptomyces TaxID=2593676 RepID=UPI0030E0AEC5|nr:hypothetical protein OG217_25335 [Streptomyces sp. NBC_01023]
MARQADEAAEVTPPARGALVYDPATDRVGEFRDNVAYATLRPLGGGPVWQADPERIRPATPAERISAGVRAANDRTRDASALPRFNVSRPPLPVPGCETCADLAEQRDRARARFDGSDETDANVLLRRHQQQEHRT